MTEKGIIERSEGGKLFVAVASSGCTGCKATCIGCGKRRIIRARPSSEENFSVGERVELVTSDRTALLLMVSVLLIPLLILMAAYLVLSPFFSSPLVPALISVGIALLYLCLFALIAKVKELFLPRVYKAE